jgi:hypothetical protein
MINTCLTLFAVMSVEVGNRALEGTSLLMYDSKDIAEILKSKVSQT